MERIDGWPLLSSPSIAMRLADSSMARKQRGILLNRVSTEALNRTRFSSLHRLEARVLFEREERAEFARVVQAESEAAAAPSPEKEEEEEYAPLVGGVTCS